MVSDSVRAYTIQCANCSKWRFIPTKQKYEQIRETIAELPFHCETAREWRPEITCDDEPDLVKDGSWRWAIDKPCIPQPPRGWQRILRIRAEGGSKFADVYVCNSFKITFKALSNGNAILTLLSGVIFLDRYYDAPSGKRLRSMSEIQR
ncbi:Methyl-CpG-binding domain-containing protein 2 [Forsythia ovata]|uniref:Methyl-CpG-binding domain-containing protein 2 n=1 Tax=Forsythia ovata TaxID=205694 RepID=A0ABD1VG74_9LAMI